MNKSELHPFKNEPLKAIIGLGNPGKQYEHNRHNIGFRILDALANQYNISWQKNDLMYSATLEHKGNKILLIKPQTYMNSSGLVIPVLQKKGINPENILVVHDELELPFGAVKFKQGTSAKGHNGLKSIMQYAGNNFVKLSCGIARPINKEDVPNYVLQNFQEPSDHVDMLISQACNAIHELLAKQ